MSNLLTFPLKTLQHQQQRQLDCTCLGCSEAVDPADSYQIEVPSMKRLGGSISVLCRECYEETPTWVWAAE